MEWLWRGQPVRVLARNVEEPSDNYPAYGRNADTLVEFESGDMAYVSSTDLRRA